MRQRERHSNMRRLLKDVLRLLFVVLRVSENKPKRGKNDEEELEETKRKMKEITTIRDRERDIRIIRDYENMKMNQKSLIGN